MVTVTTPPGAAQASTHRMNSGMREKQRLSRSRECVLWVRHIDTRWVFASLCLRPHLCKRAAVSPTDRCEEGRR